MSYPLSPEVGTAIKLKMLPTSDRPPLNPALLPCWLTHLPGGAGKHTHARLHAWGQLAGNHGDEPQNGFQPCSGASILGIIAPALLQKPGR